MRPVDPLIESLTELARPFSKVFGLVFVKQPDQLVQRGGRWLFIGLITGERVERRLGSFATRSTTGGFLPRSPSTVVGLCERNPAFVGAHTLSSCAAIMCLSPSVPEALSRNLFDGTIPFVDHERKSMGTIRTVESSSFGEDVISICNVYSNNPRSNR